MYWIKKLVNNFHYFVLVRNKFAVQYLFFQILHHWRLYLCVCVWLRALEKEGKHKQTSIKHHPLYASAGYALWGYGLTFAAHCSVACVCVGVFACLCATVKIGTENSSVSHLASGSDGGSGS